MKDAGREVIGIIYLLEQRKRRFLCEGGIGIMPIVWFFGVGQVAKGPGISFPPRVQGKRDLRHVAEVGLEFLIGVEDGEHADRLVIFERSQGGFPPGEQLGALRLTRRALLLLLLHLVDDPFIERLDEPAICRVDPIPVGQRSGPRDSVTQIYIRPHRRGLGSGASARLGAGVLRH